MPVATLHRLRLSAPLSSITPCTYLPSGDSRRTRSFARIRGLRRGNCHRPGLRSNRLRTAQAKDQNAVADQLFLSESKSYVLANSPLRGMSAVPDSISDRVQPLRQ